MKTSRTAIMTVLVAPLMSVVWACGGEENQESESESEPAAAVMITSPANEQILGASVTIQLETRGVEVRPAGTNEPGTGHHHLFIDRDITPVGVAIPTDEGVVHLGMAQTEYTVENLAPGEHTIIAVLGDYLHVRLADVATDTVRVTVEGT